MYASRIKIQLTWSQQHTCSIGLMAESSSTTAAAETTTATHAAHTAVTPPHSATTAHGTAAASTAAQNSNFQIRTSYVCIAMRLREATGTATRLRITTKGRRLI